MIVNSEKNDTMNTLYKIYIMFNLSGLCQTLSCCQTLGCSI